jgi:hypothetical protein
MRKNVQEVVCSDTGTELGVWINDFQGSNTFGLVISDGGGYTSLRITVDTWDAVKKNIDALLEEHGLRVSDPRCVHGVSGKDCFECFIPGSV